MDFSEHKENVFRSKGGFRFSFQRVATDSQPRQWLYDPAVRLSPEDKVKFGRLPIVGQHRLHESDLFSDESLIELLDRFPRKNLHALTMGNDHTRLDENRLAIHEGVSGADLLRAVRKGRFWLNITRVDRADARYRRLIDELYAQLAAQIPGFVPQFSQGSLIISSPHAVVYYHADAPASALWHFRGRKRIWVYPAMDERYLPREALEDIFADVRHEYLAFDHSYDKNAVVYDLEPGQWTAWAHNAPHRVTNLDSLNVSLSTEHFTRESRGRARVYAANRFFRVRLGIRNLSAREVGAGALIKTAIHRMAAKMGLDPLQVKRHIPTLRVDANAPAGVVPLETKASADPGQETIDVRCFKSFQDAAVLRDEMNALNLVSARPDPFSSFEFLENYFHHDELYPRGEGVRLWLLTAFKGGRLVGYLVLKQVTRRVLGIKTKRLGFLVTHDTDRPHLVAKSEDMKSVSAAFYTYLLGRHSEWSFLEFHQQDLTSSLFPPPLATKLRGYLVREWPSMENGTIHIHWRTPAEYFHALSSNSRMKVKRLLRRLLAAGKLELLSSSHPHVTPSLFELYQTIEPHSWKSKAKAHIGRHPERIEYFKGLLHPEQPMRISIHVLLLNGQPIAGIITGAFLSGLYALHSVYDDRMSRLAPGAAVLLIGIRQAIEGGFKFFNLLSGFSYYKLHWLAKITETRVGQIYRVGRFPFWSRMLGDCRRWLFTRQNKEQHLFFNPTRRHVRASEKQPAVFNANTQTQIDPIENRNIETLVEQVREAQAEYAPADTILSTFIQSPLTISAP